MREPYIWGGGGGKNFFLNLRFEGSQAVPTRPSGRDTVCLREGEASGSEKVWGLKERIWAGVLLRTIRLIFISRWKSSIIVKYLSYIGRATLWRNFDVIIERALCKACSTTWNFGANSAFALGSRKTTKILDQFGRSQDFPDANWFLANCRALSKRTLTLVPIWLLLYWKSLHICFTGSFLCAYFG
jgi:hypothetical protein